MIDTESGLKENAQQNQSSASIFSESFVLEEYLQRYFGPRWHMESYIDEKQIEHIHVYQTPEITCIDDFWEVLEHMEAVMHSESLSGQEEMEFE